jgi:thiol:disulfide interchange protein
MKSLVALALLAACQKSEPPHGKLELVDAQGSAELAPVIATEVARAQHDGKRLLVYLGASWCEPCTHFHDAAAAGQLDAAFGDLRLLVFDADRDNDALERAGYTYQMIPLFALPKPDGRSSGKQIEGSIKGADAVQQIAPRLRALVDANP